MVKKLKTQGKRILVIIPSCYSQQHSVPNSVRRRRGSASSGAGAGAGAGGGGSRTSSSSSSSSGATYASFEAAMASTAGLNTSSIHRPCYEDEEEKEVEKEEEVEGKDGDDDDEVEAEVAAAAVTSSTTTSFSLTTLLSAGIGVPPPPPRVAAAATDRSDDGATTTPSAASPPIWRATARNSHRRLDPLTKRDREFLAEMEDEGILYSVPYGAEDDWYWMYATVYEGRSKPALVVSNDLMRDHKLAFTDPKMFMRWRTSQIMYFGFSNAVVETSDTSSSSSEASMQSESEQTDEDPELYLYEPGRFHIKNCFCVLFPFKVYLFVYTFLFF
jgi:hypothetical protein